MALTSPGLIKGANQVLVDVAPELNLIKLFAYDCSDAVAEAGAKVRVAIASGGTAESYNASSANYEHETGSLDDVFVTLSTQPKSTIGLTSMDALELAESPYWNTFADATGNSVSASISATIGGLFTTTNCTGGKITMASVTKAAIAGLRANCVGRVANSVLLLAPDYYAETLSLLDSGVFGGVEGGVLYIVDFGTVYSYAYFGDFYRSRRVCADACCVGDWQEFFLDEREGVFFRFFGCEWECIVNSVVCSGVQVAHSGVCYFLFVVAAS